MGTPGQDLIESGKLAGSNGFRWNRAGIAVEGEPGLIDRALPPDSYDGAKEIDTPERVDLVLAKQDNTNVRIKYRTS